MGQKGGAPLPLHLDLSGSWVLEWDAVDPVTGDSVAGVVVSNTSLHVEGDAALLASFPIPILLGVGQ